ncbi:MAG TPA: hypothetical protein DCW31_08370 [Lactobacillus sp.]|nr:hypothetical protein [Lactobacillus sp.]
MSHKILSSLSYLSIFFLPVLFPLIVWIAASGQRDVTVHAAHAFWTQLLPTIMAFGIFFFVAVYGLTIGPNAGLGWFSLLLIGIMALLSLILWLYNVVMGIRVLLV